jgi:hypothetical protein
MYLMTVACKLLDVPRMTIVCETKGTHKVSRKMNDIGAAIKDAVDHHLPVDDRDGRDESHDGSMAREYNIEVS